MASPIDCTNKVLPNLSYFASNLMLPKCGPTTTKGRPIIGVVKAGSAVPSLAGLVFRSSRPPLWDTEIHVHMMNEWINVQEIYKVLGAT